MKVVHYARNSSDNETLQYMNLTLWNGASFKEYDTYWDSNRINNTLALRTRVDAPNVPIATRITPLSRKTISSSRDRGERPGIRKTPREVMRLRFSIAVFLKA
jgi:hypothetical protein